MSIYYVSANGADTNDGLSEKSPIRSILKVNEIVRPGDEIRFRRGDAFYGKVITPRGKDESETTVYTAYGEGEKPIISAFKIPKKGAWEKHAENIYKIDLSDVSRYDGNIYDPNFDANVGFIRVSGKIYPHKRFAYEDLAVQWDFYNDKSTLYVYSEQDPSALSDEICLACRLDCLTVGEYVRVTELCFRGIGAHGINGGGHHVRIDHCEFREIGGSELTGYRTPNTRYGNGVQFWSNCHDCVVENCKFSDIYDVAITMQGTLVKTSWENMFFRNNIMWNNQQCFEIWDRGTLPGTGFINCYFENNICIDSGYCWGYEVRPNKDCSSHLLIYELECPLCNITVRNNIFVHARTVTLYKSGGVAEMPKDYKIYDNLIIRPTGQKIVWKANTPDEVSDAYEAVLCQNNTVVERDHYESNY